MNAFPPGGVFRFNRMVLMLGIVSLFCSCQSKTEVSKPKPRTAWHLTEDEDSMTDAKRFLVSASDGHGSSFFATCNQTFGVSSDLYLGNGTDLARLEYRLDQLPAKSVFAHAKDEQVILASPADPTGDELLVGWSQMMMAGDLSKPHKRLLVRLRSVSGDTRTLTFDANGLAAALSQLAKLCTKQTNQGTPAQ